MAQVQRLWRGFLQEGGGPFSTILTVQDIVDRLSQTGVATCHRLFTPRVTLGTCGRHIHRDAPSCRAAVARLKAPRVAQDLEPGSPRTGGSCQARQQRAASLLAGLMPPSGQRLQPQGPPAWHWQGRAVKLVAGAGVSRPETEAKQHASPQPRSQTPGRGVPVARLVVVLSLACGAGLVAAIGRLKGPQSRETRLCHGLHATLARAEVVLAERSSCS